ncbi:MAG: GAF domain-containing protein [Bradyrhizobiaceae bacterium]|nr:GAF domain-containing protein [Bradyrhizobiaceae bacterium]
MKAGTRKKTRLRRRKGPSPLSHSIPNTEERYRLVVEALAEGIYEWSIDTNRLELSRGLREMLGFKKGELSSTSWMERMHPDDRKRYCDAAVDCFKQLTPHFACEYRIRNSAGEWRWLSDHAGSVRNKTGRVLRLIGVVTDITKLRHQEVQLREALQQQSATAHIFNAISRSSFDLQTVLNSLVESATRLCDADHAYLFQRQGDRLIWVASFGDTPEVQEQIKEYFKPRQVFADRGSVTGRVFLEGNAVHIPDVLADPEYTWAGAQNIGRYRAALGVPLLRDGRVVGVIFVGKTVPHPFSDSQIELVRTFADQAVIAIESVRLLNALRERTDELSEKSRQLEIANTDKARFLAAASHDLRQPLHALNLFVAQLHLDHSNAEERTRLVSRIDAAMIAMNELFDSLLDISKLDAGILEPTTTEFPIARLFSRLQTTFAEAAREKKIRLKVVSSSAWVRSDPILLERILLNLVSNAVRYTIRGGVVVGCRKAGTMLRIDVCDTGEGIPKDKQKEVFSEFYQLDTPDRDRLGGLGLGLSIVDRLARLLGHTVGLSSRVGRGTRFSVLVPRVKSKGKAAHLSTIPLIANRAQNKLIVVMDDDTLVRDGMRGILRSWGCRVVAAASDTEALAQLSEQESRPDLIISDYRLAGGHTGITAIANLRNKLGAQIPAFIVTGDTSPERLREVDSAGYQLLQKPLSPMTLRTVVDRLLKESGPAG